MGTDSNVYNDGVSPREDFTYSVTPRLYAVVPIGHTRFMGTARGDFIYYRTYKDQQSANGFFEGRYDVLEAPIRPFASASFATHRERQGLEIDARARQTQTTMTLGAEVEVTPVTSVTGWVRRETAAWDRNEQYLGVSLAEQLNSTTDILAAGARFRLTPFTSIVAAAEIQRDRFEQSPQRDADSLRIAPMVEFDNGAVITGRARAGYRMFRPLSAGLADFNGLVSSVELEWNVLDLTRVQLESRRDVRFSYDALQPYYLETGVIFKVKQQVVGPFEAIAIGERWRLRHQRVGGTAFDGRREDLTTIGAGIGVRMGEQMELTFTLEQMTRTSSQAALRNYERRRVFASISYGL
jgi:hypothetical protein